MEAGLFRSAPDMGQAFLGATFQKPHEAASRPGVSANHALNETLQKLPEVQAQIDSIGAKLGIAPKPEASPMATASGSGIGGKLLGVAALTAAAAISPVAAAGIAVAEGIGFMASKPSALAEYEGQTSFKNYARSPKAGRASASDDAYAAQQIANYTDAEGGKWDASGYAARPNAAPSAPQTRRSIMPGDSLPSREMDQLAREYATRIGQRDELEVQGRSARAYAMNNNIAMEQGPPPPRVTGPMLSPAGMG
jgi:hypothetical protein